MRRYVLLQLALAFGLFAQPNASQPNALTPQEAAAGWRLLFDGRTLAGWAPEGKVDWRVEGGAIVADVGEYGWLRTEETFADFVLRCEFRQAADGNSGVFLRSAREGQPHLTGYELQIFDAHPEFPTGSLLGSLKAEPVKLTPGAWHTFEVRVQGDRFVVRLDNRVVLDGRDAKSRTGHIGLQHNKDKKIEFRNIRLKRL